MKHCLISNYGSDRLILIFAGWGMDENTFRGINRPGYDVMVVWDYRSMYIDWSCVNQYSEICLLAWSLGVYAASQTIQAIEYKITRRIAVNGTLTPIDDHYGIPEAIYQGTLDGLNERNLSKFYRRMCATSDDLKHFSDRLPQRSVNDLKEELRTIADRLILSTPTSSNWDLAIIGQKDRIFAPFNQRKAWSDTKNSQYPIEIKVIDTGHYLDFQELIDRHFIDKETMCRRFKSGTSTYTTNAFVQIEIISKLMKMIKLAGLNRELSDSHGNILEIGSGSGTLSYRIAEAAPNAHITLWDIAANKPIGMDDNIEFVQCDAELQLRREISERFAYIFSASTIHWFNSPDNFMRECYRTLIPGGYAFLTTYTIGNMEQITALTGNTLPLMSIEQWKQIAARYFEIIDIQNYIRDIDFETPNDVLRHLKLTGVNSLGRTSKGNANVRNIIQRYPMMLDGRYHLTYRPLILILHKQ